MYVQKDDTYSWQQLKSIQNKIFCIVGPLQDGEILKYFIKWDRQTAKEDNTGKQKKKKTPCERIQ